MFNHIFSVCRKKLRSSVNEQVHAVVRSKYTLMKILQTIQLYIPVPANRIGTGVLTSL